MDDVNPVYLVLFVILILSLLYHIYLHKKIQIPDEKNAPKEYTYELLVNNMHSNVIKTFIFGVIASNVGIYPAIKNAAIYGILSPILLVAGF